MNFSILLVVLCFSATVFAVDCTKISNSTDCVWYDGPNPVSEFVHALSTLKFGPPLQDGSRTEYQACIKLLVSRVCVKVEYVDIDTFFANITLSLTLDGITIWSAETTLPELFPANGGFCLDDNTILEILLLIPELQDDAKIIAAILAATGCHPRGLFEMCFFFYNQTCAPVPALESGFEPAPVDDFEALVCGCFTFEFQLLYWRNYCLYKDESNLGCVGTAAAVFTAPDRLIGSDTTTV